MRNKETRKKWVSENKERLKVARRRHKLKADYGMTVEQYNQLLEFQNHSCAICKTPFKANGSHNEKAHIDHCHASGVVRGLLCGFCNMGLGKLKDSIHVLESALKYLRSTQERKE
jgi:hypothetical protein